MALDGAAALQASPVRTADAELRAEIVRGLSARPKRLPQRLLQEARRSNLFEALRRQPEHYLARAEASILAAEGPAIAEFLGAHCVLVEPGASGGDAMRSLLKALDRPTAYVPADLSENALAAAARNAREALPGVRVHGLLADPAMPLHLQLTAHVLPGPRAFVSAGSTISMHEPPAAQRLLATWRAGAGPEGKLIVGFDLWKEAAKLERAWNDRAGVAAQLNLDLLGRLNREFDGTFDLQSFAHHVHVDPRTQRVELYLVNLRPQRVRVAGQRFDLDASEPLHTGNLYAYTASAFCRLASSSGWQFRARWMDPARAFNVHAYDAGR